MGSIPDDKISEILEKVDLVDIVSRYVTLKKVGKNYFGLCPFHSEKTPSFSVSPDKQLYYCFGCGARGNAITFLMQIEGLSFAEALKELADMAGVELVFSQKEREKTFVKNNLREVLELARDFYRERLFSQKGEKAREYLAGRGMGENTMREWELGYAPDEWAELRNFLRKKGVSDNLAGNAGLIIKSKDSYYDRFRDRIVFPIYDQRHKIVGFGGRVLDKSSENVPKYLNSPETPLFIKGKLLFGLNRASSFVTHSGEVILVEGYLDVISLWEKGIKNVVAPLGTGLTEDQVRILVRLADRVFVSFDGDEAGRKAASRAVEILVKMGVEHFVILLPQGEDPDSFVKNYGIEKWDEIKSTAIPGFRFFIDYHLRRFSLSPEGVAKCSSVVASLLGKVGDRVLRELYIKEASNILGVSESALWSKVDAELIPEERTEKQEVKSGFYPEEEVILSYVLNNPEMVKKEYVVEKVKESIISPVALEILQKWVFLVERGRFLPAMITGEDEELSGIVAHLSSRDVTLTPSEFSRLVLNLELRKLRLTQEKISREIAVAEKNGDREKVMELLEKKNGLLSKIKEISGSRGEIVEP